MNEPKHHKHTMKKELLFLGLDVHAQNIAIALAEGGGGEARTEAGEDWLRAALEPQRAMARAIHAQILELDARLAAVAAQELTVPLPHGLGQLTALTACLEVMDWRRFGNRKQAGSDIGCASSEHSTGPGQLLGGIDRQGNRRLRSLLTEAIWRLIRWEPGWHGFTKWGAIVRETHGSTVRKKKAVIACVRLLFIDLWRLFTGRATLADLGFKGAPAAPTH
jgi:transposase